MSDQTVVEIRSKIRAMLYSEGADSVSGRRPLVAEEKREAARRIDGRQVDEDASAFFVESELLDAVGFDAKTWAFWAERGTGPLTKDELSAIWDALSREQNPAFGPIGSEDVEESNSRRSWRKPQPDERRFQVLAAFAVNGPGTSAEVAQESSVELSSVTSESTRLWRDYLLGRTKQESFEDVYTYWVRPEGIALLDRLDVSGVDESAHRELYEQYSPEPMRKDD